MVIWVTLYSMDYWKIKRPFRNIITVDLLL